MTITGDLRVRNLQTNLRAGTAAQPPETSAQVADSFTTSAAGPSAPTLKPTPVQTGTETHPDSTGRIRHLALQLDAQASPEINAEVSAAWTTLFKTMEPDTKFTVSLENQKAKQDLLALLEREGVANPERFNILVADDLNITMWARDQMIGLNNKGGGETLLGQTTMRPHGDDELLPPRIAASIPSLGFDGDKRLQTDGGDEVSNPNEVFLGYTSLYLTAKRLYETSRKDEAKAAVFSPFEQTLQVSYPDNRVAVPDFKFERNIFKSQVPEKFPQQDHWMAEAQGLFEETYGRPVTVVGEDRPETPTVEQPATFHIDMGLTPVDSDKMLVGDPSVAIEALRSLTPEEYADHNARLNRSLGYPETQDTLGTLLKENTENQPELQHNFDVNARKMADKGYDITRLPYLQGPPGVSWITYNNCIMENFTREDGTAVRRVFLPTFDLPALDNIAKQTYEQQGFEVVPLKLPALTSWRGAIRCITNIIDRDA